MKTARNAKRQSPLIIGNWKMNPGTLAHALELGTDLKKMLPKNGNAQVYVAPPVPFATAVGTKIKKSRILLGAQNVHGEEKGAHTGEVSVEMLKSIDVSLVIVGHSERRAQGETDAEVSAKAQQVLKRGLISVVCIGEKKRDKEGNYFNEVESQLRAIVKVLPTSVLSRFVIAYEPVWAIGTGKHATAEDVQEMKLFIQKIIADTLGRAAVAKVRILYGGSVTQDNAQALLEIGQADGFLVGGASLKSVEFSRIVKIADTYAK